MKKDFIIALYSILIAGIASIFKGMDRSFDVRNYHIYNPYAFLTGRQNDIMPADIQSYFNPLPDIPYFLMLQHFNNFPVIIAFVQGLSYALLLFLIYKTSQLIFKGKYKTLLTVLSVLIGGTAALTLYNIGTLTHDIFIGDLVLISIYFLLKTFDKFNFTNVVISGIVLGIACGLKLTAGIFGLAIILAVIFFKFEKPFKTFLTLCISSLIGFLAVNGFWMYKLYCLYGNPFIPYFNNIFHSNFVNSGNMLQEDFGNLYPENTFEYLFFPFLFYQHLPVKAFEVNYQDFRFAAIYVVLIINLIVDRFFKNKVRDYGINFSKINFLFLICIFTYIIWVNTFATVRYLTPIAALSGIIVLASLVKFFSIAENFFNFEKILEYKNFKFTYKSIILPGILIWAGTYLIFTTIEPDMLKRIPLKSEALYVDTMDIPDNSIVITMSGAGILIPYQNPKASYIYLNAPRFTERNLTILSTKTHLEIIDLIKNHKDRTYFMLDLAIYRKTFRLTETALKNYMGIEFDNSSCKIVNTNIESKKTRSFYVLCKAEIK